MAWSNLTTITDAAVLTAAELNKYKDNLDYLRKPRQGGDIYIGDKITSDWAASLTSTSWTQMDTNLNLTVNNVGEPILANLMFTGYISTAGVTAHFDFEVDGSRVGHSTDGLWKMEYSINTGVLEFRNLLLSKLLFLSTGSHTIKPFYKLSGAGTFAVSFAYSWARML